MTARFRVRVLFWLLGLWAVVVAAHRAAAAEAAPRKLSNSAMAAHVLNRLAFGPRPAEVQSVIKTTWQKWVDEQLRPDSLTDESAEKLVAAKCPSLALSLTQLQRLGSDEKQTAKLKRELVDSVILRSVYSRRQFQEVIVNFWRNHFNVYFDKAPLLATHYEEQVLRKHAFGKFEDLLMATAKHPAMLVYLDNHVSRARRLNENYARELMELHTLGVDNGYAQRDVIDLARVLTGWTCDWQAGKGSENEYGFLFRREMHDYDQAVVVSLQLDGAAGVGDGERAISHLAKHENTARFIAAKLCRYLVSDEPPQPLVDRVAETFRKTGGDLGEVYRAIIMDQEFANPKHYRSKFKTPFEFVISVLRTTDAQIDSTDRLRKELNLMGQPIYECVEPTGYYDQSEAWLDPGVMVYRWNFAIDLVQGKVEGVKIGAEFAEQVLKPQQRTRTSQIMANVLPGVADSVIKKIILQTNDIRAMVALALGSPAYQQQ